ncbi:hypothetical protein [Nocardiopsis gilva]|nr:hypothetical protein [Nocardiopsis gilva]
MARTAALPLPGYRPHETGTNPATWDIAVVPRRFDGTAADAEKARARRF